MTVYTRLGATVQIVEAEQRRRWWIHYGSRTEVFDKPPTAAQRKRAKEESEFDIWWIRAKLTGPYPDGSGQKDIGKLMEWRTENDFCATDGIRELHGECESVVERKTNAKLNAVCRMLGI